MSQELFFIDDSMMIDGEKFLEMQSEVFRRPLTQIYYFLMSDSKKSMPGVKPLPGQQWLIELANENGEPHFFVVTKNPSAQDYDWRGLMINDPNGSHNSVGGDHPGYWSWRFIYDRMSKPEQRLLLEIIASIRAKAKSEYYEVFPDGGVTIVADFKSPDGWIKLNFYGRLL